MTGEAFYTSQPFINYRFVNEPANQLVFHKLLIILRCPIRSVMQRKLLQRFTHRRCSLHLFAAAIRRICRNLSICHSARIPDYIIKSSCLLLSSFYRSPKETAGMSSLQRENVFLIFISSIHCFKGLLTDAVSWIYCRPPFAGSAEINVTAIHHESRITS